jgi:hypothetical protein
MKADIELAQILQRPRAFGKSRHRGYTRTDAVLYHTSPGLTLVGTTKLLSKVSMICQELPLAPTPTENPSTFCLKELEGRSIEKVGG